ncbi:hypothetical protein DFH07DRAFT_980335 [Mycena maculata]|uniref:Uncharacterized protein n=1 Tax=Mycena maculata TaxID=230809 RepID=A0AAD7IIH9_9AGAR|nr:hypothetical protein DFH07DRAFT_980335 [Mycena maculata]
MVWSRVEQELQSVISSSLWNSDAFQTLPSPPSHSCVPSNPLVVTQSARHSRVISSEEVEVGEKRLVLKNFEREQRSSKGAPAFKPATKGRLATASSPPFNAKGQFHPSRVGLKVVVQYQTCSPQNILRRRKIYYIMLTLVEDLVVYFSLIPTYSRMREDISVAAVPGQSQEPQEDVYKGSYGYIYIFWCVDSTTTRNAGGWVQRNWSAEGESDKARKN